MRKKSHHQTMKYSFLCSFDFISNKSKQQDIENVFDMVYFYP